jgi:hypothetical protein
MSLVQGWCKKGDVPMSTRLALRVLSLILGSASLFLPALARGDIVIFKDGHMIYGKVSRDGETITDPSGQAFQVPKGPFFILDGARRIYFSHAHVAAANNKDLHEGIDIVKLQRPVSRIFPKETPPLLDLRDVTPWSANWERQYDIGYFLNGKHWVTSVDQRLTFLSPYYARVDAKTFTWSGFYQTSELGPETVRKLLTDHPDLKVKGDKSDIPRLFRVARFLTQAGWYDLADDELVELEKKFPTEKDKVAESRKHLQKLRAMQQLEEIERGAKVGRHRWVQQQLAELPRDLLDDLLAARARILAEKYETNNEALKQALRLLKDLPPRVTVPAEQKLLGEAAQTIATELTYDTVEQLEVFVKQSLEAERARAQDRSPDNSPTQLLCMAVTGWLLGKDAADAKYEVTQRLWTARNFLLTYLRSENGDEREKMIKEFQSLKTDAIPVDEMAQLIRTLPPVDPDTKLLGNFLERELKGSGRRKGPEYLIQLPSEFTHARSYPVVFVLCHGTETPKDALTRCSAQGLHHGCILVAPNWSGALNQKYQYTTEEHALVLNVLREMRRRYPVDSDRVFLLGFGEGANMAYDVGLSHPDLFAGVLCVSGGIKPFVRAYQHNAQILPFYIVHGSHAGEYTKQNMQLAERMVTDNYPVLQVVYKGRGMEFFEAELPQMFDWISHKPRRLSGFPVLGERHEYVTMRETDNHFYWISTDSIAENRLTNPDRFRANVMGATVTARIGEGNQINITEKGLKQVTIWLGRDSQGREMIDFAKPVTVRIDGREVLRSAKVPMNLETMLEDLHQRGDRQQLFVAKLTFNLR